MFRLRTSYNNNNNQHKPKLTKDVICKDGRMKMLLDQQQQEVKQHNKQRANLYRLLIKEFKEGRL